MADAKYLPYHEPAVSTLLVYASFILVLNIVNAILNKLLYCGLIGQILVGVCWGVPGANWLSLEAQETIVQLGYLGLILLVYEGGLSTSLASVRQNVWLSVGVALTGILLPIGLSFTLMPLLDASAVQAFAAGAALCSTSLGTTFTVLSTCNLINTRLGTVLTTAAMMDDVVGLIMVQVVSELGASGGNVAAVTVLRPVGVSFAVVLVLVLVCRYVVKPLCMYFLPRLQPVLVRMPHAAFISQSLFLLGIFTGATYAGTSGLFAAYLAGVTMTWWDKACFPSAIGSQAVSLKTGSKVFQSSYATITNVLLKPFFFASIGFSIPVSQLFAGSAVWRGIIYAILMLVGKLATGLWLVRLSKYSAPSPMRSRADEDTFRLSRTTSSPDTGQRTARTSTSQNEPEAGAWLAVSVPANVAVRREPARTASSERHGSHMHATVSDLRRDSQSPQHEDPQTMTETPRRTLSLYPPCLLGLAMAARGEIGYLIASVAESSGIFSSESRSEGASEIFLVVVWAVSLCTLIGPVCVGLLVRRIRRLEKEKGGQSGRHAVLGDWGVGVSN